MKIYKCQCGNTLYYTNSLCLTCQRPVGFLPDALVISSCEINDEGDWVANYNGQLYRQCINYSEQNICNWLVPIASDQRFCSSCQLTDTIPDLSKPDNIKLWFRMEQAKRHLLYTLHTLKLPIIGKRHTPDGLSFRFLEDEVEQSLYNRELTVRNTVLTGHSHGVITINLKEAEETQRLAMRELMNERYRTLIGHFRHESGHYYWDVLVKDSQYIEPFRILFGDEREDYQQSLERYYAQGPDPQWQQNCISAYASMHPWEDWAETWAHYLHMVETLETAHEYGTRLSNRPLTNPVLAEHPHTASYNEQSFDTLIDDWDQLTNLLNALNSSMGLDAAYPFVINEKTCQKLHFIHLLVRPV